MAALLLRFEVAAAGFGVLFAVTAVLVCVLLALRARTQRKHDQQITDVKVRWGQYSYWLCSSDLDVVGQCSRAKFVAVGVSSKILPWDVCTDVVLFPCCACQTAAGAMLLIMRSFLLLYVPATV